MGDVDKSILKGKDTERKTPKIWRGEAELERRKEVNREGKII